MKKCSKCNRLLPESSFKLKKGKLYYMCKECEKEYMREYRQRNKNHINKQFDALPDYCEVCGSTTNLCIDHDHSTGKVRGTLCSRCNQALGLMRDNYRNIIKLANYLIKDETVQI